MLRFLILLALVINAAFWGWTQGWFGTRPDTQNREPERIASQIQADALHPISADELSAPLAVNAGNSSNPAPTPTPDSSVSATPSSSPSTTAPEESPTPVAQNAFCIESGPLSSAQTGLLQQQLNTILPDREWEFNTQLEPASWAVYIGAFDSEELARQRKAELAAQGIDSELVRGREQYQPGLTLGLFRERNNADRKMSGIVAKNVTDAKLIPWSFSAVGQVLKIANATQQQHEQLNALASQINAPTFVPCKSAENTPL